MPAADLAKAECSTRPKRASGPPGPAHQRISNRHWFVIFPTWRWIGLRLRPRRRSDCSLSITECRLISARLGEQAKEAATLRKERRHPFCRGIPPVNVIQVAEQDPLVLPHVGHPA